MAFDSVADCNQCPRPKRSALHVTLVLLWRFKKLPEPLLVLAAAVIGLGLYPLVRG